MSKQQIRLSESQFHQLVKEMVNQIVKSKLNEGFADREMDEKWMDAERQIGSENMLQAVYDYFSGDQLKDFLESLDNDYDLGLFNDDYEDDEEEYELWESRKQRSKKLLREFGFDNKREDLIGMNVDDAIAQLKKEGWRVSERDEKREGNYLTTVGYKRDGNYNASIYVVSTPDDSSRTFTVTDATECYN